MPPVRRSLPSPLARARAGGVSGSLSTSVCKTISSGSPVAKISSGRQHLWAPTPMPLHGPHVHNLAPSPGDGGRKLPDDEHVAFQRCHRRLEGIPVPSPERPGSNTGALSRRTLPTTSAVPMCSATAVPPLRGRGASATSCKRASRRWVGRSQPGDATTAPRSRSSTANPARLIATRRPRVSAINLRLMGLQAARPCPQTAGLNLQLLPEINDAIQQRAGHDGTEAAQRKHPVHG